MAKIEFFALGGLDEHAKECYVLNVNGDLYLINVGIDVPSSVSLGVKRIIPDYSWINENKRFIKGIFIGTPSYAHFGSLEFFHQFIPNIPIYATDIGASILNIYFDKRARRHELAPIKLNIHIIEPLKTERTGACMVTPFRISNSMPKSVGFVFDTSDGAVIYVDDFIISSNKNASFEDQIFEINKITHGKNLMLITGMGLAGKNNGFTAPNHRVAAYFDTILSDNENRVVIAVYDDDVYKILSIAHACSVKNRPFSIYSNTFIELYKFLNAKGYYVPRNLQLLNDSQLDTSTNGVIVVTGTPARLYTKLSKIIGDDDPKFHLKENDAFVFAETTIPGYETFEAELFDSVARTDIDNIYKLPKNIIKASASNEDHKFLVELIKPKYIIPVSGLYMDFVEYARAVAQTGFMKQNVIMLENGQCVSFNNGIIDSKKKFIKLEPQFIGTQGVLDVGASSLFERDQMKENGVVLLSLLFDKETKLIKKYNYDAVGVTNLSEENKTIINAIVEFCNKEITTILADGVSHAQIDMKNIKMLIRKMVSKQFEKKFNKKPLVLSTIIFVKHAKPQTAGGDK
ncbi:MAG: ribonuclease J [Mycoplasmataceae bacterium]|nr:ribonuclease J [Mycoplasmataceae bacterium]